VMLMGASVSFAITSQTDSAWLGLLAGAVVGGLFNMVFAFVVVTRRANQLAAGLALMFFGQGLSALLGKPFVGAQIDGFNEIPIPILKDIPIVGPVLFSHDILVYLVVPTAILVWWVLFRTRWGLNIRTVGESPTTAFAAGRNPALLKYEALLVAGILGGIAGAHLSLAFTKTWTEDMTAGRGFIAVALVIFSMWRPLRTIVGALLFGGAVALQLQLQAMGVAVSPFILDMLPYLLTLVVLIVWGRTQKYAAPAWLGRSYEGVE
ncbi:MAG TPA: ABC transporter permease, partial [Aggregatilineaceae bacterium]|nr:ABC transporter permease [Aggregatilineaceae bacterium]